MAKALPDKLAPVLRDGRITFGKPKPNTKVNNMNDEDFGFQFASVDGDSQLAVTVWHKDGVELTATIMPQQTYPPLRWEYSLGGARYSISGGSLGSAVKDVMFYLECELKREIEARRRISQWLDGRREMDERMEIKRGNPYTGTN